MRKFSLTVATLALLALLASGCVSIQVPEGDIVVPVSCFYARGPVKGILDRASKEAFLKTLPPLLAAEVEAYEVAFDKGIKGLEGAGFKIRPRQPAASEECILSDGPGTITLVTLFSTAGPPDTLGVSQGIKKVGEFKAYNVGSSHRVSLVEGGQGAGLSGAQATIEAIREARKKSR